MSGGGGSSAPTQQNVTTTNIPEYARPYVERSLGQAAALTDINQNPYQPYQGQRIADFSPLQGQAFTSLENMQTSPQMGQATDYAGTATQGGMATATPALGYGATGAGYGATATGIGGMYANMATSPGAVSAYMSPYMQNVVDLQKQEANRAFDITGAKTMGQGVAAGAFGGSRDALMRAENERNRNTALANIQAQGSQSAYDKAIQSMQYGTGIGLQGLQTGIQGAGIGLQGVQGAQNAYNLGLQGANTLTNIGNAQFAQQMSIADAQMRAGAAQQAQAQRGLDIPYQEYQEQLNYPYKQLAFQSDMFRGLPLSQSATTMYQNTGAMMPQLLGAGIAAYGATNKAAEGGIMKSYAAGGGVQVDPRALSSVSPVSLPSKLSRLSDDQLMAYARTVKDPAAREEVQAEMNRRAEARQSQQVAQAQEAQAQEAPGGIGQQPMMAAGGGIVALAGGSDKEGVADPDAPDEAERAYSAAMQPKRTQPRARPLSSTPFTVSQAELNQPTEEYVPPSETPIPAPDTATNRSNWEAQQSQAARDFEIGAERQAIAQEQANRADAVAQAYGMNTQEGTGQYPNLGGITAVPGATGTPTAATSGIPAAAPAGTTTATGTATTSAAPSSGGITTAGGTGGAPAGGGVGGLLSFEQYAAQVEKNAKTSPEDQAVINDMKARADRRMARADKQERGVMNEALVAGGLAMMGGMNISDGIRRLAESGGKQYFASQADARKAIDKAEDAQDAFNQYQIALRQGNKKIAAEMYGKYYNATTDYMGKIQAASITAGASIENAKATREATAESRRQALEQQAFQSSETIRVREAQIEQNAQQFKERMTQLGETAKANDFDRLQSLKQNALTAVQNTDQKIRAEFQKDPRYFSLFAVPESQLKPAQLKERRLLEAQLEDRIAKATSPFKNEVTNIINRQSTLMGLSTVPNASGARTYNRETGQLE